MLATRGGRLRLRDEIYIPAELTGLLAIQHATSQPPADGPENALLIEAAQALSRDRRPQAAPVLASDAVLRAARLGLVRRRVALPSLRPAHVPTEAGSTGLSAVLLAPSDDPQEHLVAVALVRAFRRWSLAAASLADGTGAAIAAGVPPPAVVAAVEKRVRALMRTAADDAMAAT